MQRPRLGGMGWPRDRCDPAGLCHARIRQTSRSLPGRRELISRQAAPYAREKRGPLHYSLKRQAAPGVDGVTWEEYGQILEARLSDLHGRIHRGAYQAKPSRRVWIPKSDGRQRPLGIAALEDKV